MQNSNLKNSLIAAGIAVFAGVVTLGANVAFSGTTPSQTPAAAGLIAPTFSGLDVNGDADINGDLTVSSSSEIILSNPVTDVSLSAVNGALKILGDTVISHILTVNAAIDAQSYITNTKTQHLTLKAGNIDLEGITELIGDLSVIGKANISKDLSVSGSIKATSLSGAGGAVVADANGLLSVGAAASSLWTASGNNIYNANTGNVGIGTNNPSVGKVVSVSTVGTASSNYVATTPGAAQSEKSGYSLYSTFDGVNDTAPRRTADIIAGFSGGAWGKEFLSLNVGSGGANDTAKVTSEKMRIQSDGKVGIGTTAPKSRLDIKGSDLVTGNLSGLTTPGLLSLNSLPYLLGGFLVQDSLNMDPSHIDAFGGKTLYINGKSEGNVSIGPDAGTNNNLQVNGKIYSTGGFGTYKTLSASISTANAGAGQVLTVNKPCGSLQLISCGVIGTGTLAGKDMIINKIVPSGNTCYAVGTTTDAGGKSTLSVSATCWDSNN
jgi:hypothetical protein